MIGKGTIARASRRQTAVHEAGHAVVACVLDIGCGGATIVVDHDEEEMGHTVFPDPWVAVGRWDEAGKYHREYGTALRARAIACMAGREAELEVAGHCQDGDGYDLRQIAFCLDSLGVTEDAELDTHEARLRRHARGLVRRHRASIDRVAGELIKHGRLTGDQIVALVNGAD